jgi:Asp-tRNA(Asn)/Glu-tRNA(Gln) amidotransferase C subunit
MATRPTTTPGPADVQALARLAGLTLPDQTVSVLTERLAAALDQLAAVPEADLAGVEPAFVLPLGKE